MAPKRVLITGAAGQIGYALAPQVCRGAMFGPDQEIILHLLDIPPAETALGGVAMELIDAAYPDARVPLYRLDFATRHEHDRARNLEVVRATLDRLDLDVPLDVKEVSRGAYRACAQRRQRGQRGQHRQRGQGRQRWQGQGQAQGCVGGQQGQAD